MPGTQRLNRYPSVREWSEEAASLAMGASQITILGMLSVAPLLFWCASPLWMFLLLPPDG
jgi:hypothetical protein